MNTTTHSPATIRLIELPGELGPRRRLPAQACRVHGYLYPALRPAPAAELGHQLSPEGPALADAPVWLNDYHLLERVSVGMRRTHRDSWHPAIRILQDRRRRELGPALNVLRDCHSDALAGGTLNGTMRL